MKTSLTHFYFKILCALVLLALPSILYAQQFSTKLYNVNDGLPGTQVFGAYQDHYGYLWVGAPTGLSRFDGRQFVNYSLADGLPSLHVTGVFQDSRERLWVGSKAGMAQFKNNKFITYPLSDSLTNLYLFNFFEKKDKNIWALTGKGVYEFSDSVWKKISLCQGYENRMCRSIIETNGELYINYGTDILCRNKDGKWIHISSEIDGSIFNVMSLQKNEIWISNVKGIYAVSNYQLVPIFKMDPNEKQFFSYLVDSKKRLWIVKQNLIEISQPGNWKHFTDSIINKYNYTFSISEDASHDIWIGTSQGLLKIKDMAFNVIDKNNIALLDGIYNIIALPDNKLIFSSGAKKPFLLYENNRAKQILATHSSGNNNNNKDIIDAYAFDKNNELWMSTRFRKFLSFNGKTLEDHSNALHIKTTEYIYDLTYVKNRNQFFVCADSTLLFGDSTNFSTFIPHNTGVPIIKPTRVRMIANGLLLLYIDGVGVYCIDAANNLIPLIKETGIDGSKKGIELPVCFYEDARNNFWISVSGLGLYEYGFTQNKLPFLKNHFTIKDGLQGNNILSITSDNQNRLWVATNTGLDILQPLKTGTYEVFNFARADELTLDDCDFVKLVTDVKGNVWLSSPNKILKFNPDNIKLYKESPHIIIEKVSLAFAETNWSKLTDSLYSYYQLPYNPVLKYDQNSLGIFFNAVDLSTSNSAPEYSYKLLPLDTSWSIPAKIKSVSFAQLPAGKYQFMVRAKDLASTWSEPAVFRFTIAPAFWNRWWFRSIIIAIVAYIIIGIFKRRIKKIKRDVFIQNQLKELEMKALKAQMNPHFIYNALNSIQALVASDKKEEGIHYIGSFSRLLRQVLDNSENNVISLDKELETIGLYIQLEELRMDTQLKFEKIIPENIVTEFEKIPPLILQPFVENALWHGLSRKEGKKEIKITISIQGDWLLCDITDNGIGRKKAQEWKSHSIELHLSKAIDITRKRLIDFNENNLVTPIEFFDLNDSEGNASGTSVNVRIRRKRSTA
ncbi:MAG: histidine kinase [Bacteroidota bacterium]|nr:histidine kinase [Bacteroidota bacterium]